MNDHVLKTNHWTIEYKEKVFTYKWNEQKYMEAVSKYLTTERANNKKLSNIVYFDKEASAKIQQFINEKTQEVMKSLSLEELIEHGHIKETYDKAKNLFEKFSTQTTEAKDKKMQSVYNDHNEKVEAKLYNETVYDVVVPQYLVTSGRNLSYVEPLSYYENNKIVSKNKKAQTPIKSNTHSLKKNKKNSIGKINSGSKSSISEKNKYGKRKNGSNVNRNDVNKQSSYYNSLSKIIEHKSVEKRNFTSESSFNSFGKKDSFNRNSEKSSSLYSNNAFYYKMDSNSKIKILRKTICAIQNEKIIDNSDDEVKPFNQKRSECHISDKNSLKKGSITQSLIKNSANKKKSISLRHHVKSTPKNSIKSLSKKEIKKSETKKEKLISLFIAKLFSNKKKKDAEKKINDNTKFVDFEAQTKSNDFVIKNRSKIKTQRSTEKVKRILKSFTNEHKSGVKTEKETNTVSMKPICFPGNKSGNDSNQFSYHLQYMSAHINENKLKSHSEVNNNFSQDFIHTLNPSSD